MHAREYQRLASRTLLANFDSVRLTGDEVSVVWNAVGLAGEAGEVAETVKKGIFHRHGLDREKMVKELGDVLWYTAALCSVMGVDMGEVMQANIDKLRQRYPDGWSTEASIARVDTK